MGKSPEVKQEDKRRVVVTQRCRHRFAVLLALLTPMFGLVACGPKQTPAIHELSIVLVEVVDGDTIIVRFPNGVEERVRLLGIDTPETVDPTRPVQCFGREASSALASLLPIGTAITLERDVEARDRYGRLLSYVYREEDGLFINATLLENGFADLSIYPPNDAYGEVLSAAVVAARTGAVGLWGACGGPDVALNPDGYQLSS